MSLFVSLEGGEGSGKSTQAKRLHERLIREGYATLLVREPGTTLLGSYLRDWLKRQVRQGDSVSPVAELFLFEAARAELVTKVIRPYLDATPQGILITDRYMDSTTAYQAYGRRIDVKKVVEANAIATQGVFPDLTFLLDITPEQGLNRVRAKIGLEEGVLSSKTRMDAEGTRRFEEESLAFHHRVRRGYLKLAGEASSRWRLVDATQSENEVEEEIWVIMQETLAGLVSINEPGQADLLTANDYSEK